MRNVIYKMLLGCYMVAALCLVCSCNDGLELYKGIREYMQYYNYNRAHQGIGRQIPAAVYKTVA